MACTAGGETCAPVCAKCQGPGCQVGRSCKYVSVYLMKTTLTLNRIEKERGEHIARLSRLTRIKAPAHGRGLIGPRGRQLERRRPAGNVAQYPRRISVEELRKHNADDAGDALWGVVDGLCRECFWVFTPRRAAKIAKRKQRWCWAHWERVRLFF